MSPISAGRQPPAGHLLFWSFMGPDHCLKRLRFRAWHRGTKEADLMIGGFFDRHASGWDEGARAWFEALLDQDDVDIMGWAMRTIAVPPRWQGPLMDRLQALDYIPVSR